MIFIPGNDESFIEWVADNPEGFVIDTDKLGISPGHPMLHHVTCAIIKGQRALEAASVDYLKVCSVTKRELEEWARREETRNLKLCFLCKQRYLL